MVSDNTMEQVRHPGGQMVNGHPQSQTYGQTGKNGGSQRMARPLSVDVALQYSPMTSSPIYGLGGFD